MEKLWSFRDFSVCDNLSTFAKEEVIRVVASRYAVLLEEKHEDSLLGGLLTGVLGRSRIFASAFKPRRKCLRLSPSSFHKYETSYFFHGHVIYGALTDKYIISELMQPLQSKDSIRALHNNMVYSTTTDFRAKSSTSR